MRKFYVLWLLVAAVLVTSCSVDYAPSCRTVSRKSVPEDARQVEIAEKAWMVLSDPSQKDSWPSATKTYNDALEVIIQRIRCSWKKGLHGDEMWKDAPYVIDRGDFFGGKKSLEYEDVILCKDVETNLYLEERVFVEGVGIPLAGIVKSDEKIIENHLIKDNGNIHTITAVIDFNNRVKGKPVLKVYPRLKVDTIRTGKVNQPLAGDFTAPLYLFRKKSGVGNAALLGMFNPKKVLNYQGLYFSEPYDPDKIPVLFTHGLMSSPATFTNLINRLMVDPVIRRHYQFWYFSYPSGVSWLIPARDLREALQAVYREYDPYNKSANLNRMVWVGHSMGGLITRLNSSQNPWAVIPSMVKGTDYVKKLDYRQIEGLELKDEYLTEKVTDLFVFKPTDRANRVVFMATPHQGSDFANRWFGALGQKMIRFPKILMREITRMGTLSSDMLLINPDKLFQEFTSIGQLSPASPAIKGIQHVQPNPAIPVHSIIGDRGHGDTPYSSDGVVRYRSSHIDWASSEKIVPAGHSVQASIPAAEEMRRILLEHLKEEGISTELPDVNKYAPTIWMDNPIEYVFKPKSFR